MTSTGRRPLRRLLVRTAAFLIVLLVLAAAWFVPRAGQYLIVEDPLAFFRRKHFQRSGDNDIFMVVGTALPDQFVVPAGDFVP